MIVFRHADRRLPFLREDASQAPGRWHAAGEGPVQYFADTPDGAWAEFLRHEEIRDPEDLATVRRAIWAVEIPDEEKVARPALSTDLATGGLGTYAACQAEARRLRARGATRLEAPSAALASGAAAGWRVNGQLIPGPPRDGRTVALFGRRPDLTGWRAAHEGRPSEALLRRVRYL